MKIIETEPFKIQRDAIVWYIAKDKKSAALNFAKELKQIVNNLKSFPYKYRPSKYYKDDSIRDMIFNGYTIVYRVKEEKNIIEVLVIFNKNLPAA
ncbi:MAG: type II toxin-antitoxin system RelE/ParE family toxin [Campylobacterota bacterium]|nr:type II toxin-antitoxin system RelE/ParE family toxin [Campylobacterota bacterium]